MTKKQNYPVEAFALAAIVYASGMKGALLVGICLLFGDVLLAALGEFSCPKYEKTLAAFAAVAVFGVTYCAWWLSGSVATAAETAGFGVLAVLLVKHNETRGEAQYGQILTADLKAYAVLLAVAVIRQLVATGMILDSRVLENPLTPVFGTTGIALLGAAIAVLAANAWVKSDCAEDAGLWVGVPAIFLCLPMNWAVGIVVCGAYVVADKKLGRSLPLMLTALAIVYLVLGLF